MATEMVSEFVCLDNGQIHSLKSQGSSTIGFASLQNVAEGHPDGIRIMVKMDGIISTLGYVTDKSPQTLLKLHLGDGDECELYLDGEGKVALFINVEKHVNDFDVVDSESED